jgi:YidC/Oxa1 family membrane protein insertase
MGVAMFFQTRLNPAPPDPMQARVMQIVPLIFTATFLLFPSGLVLYWLTNTLLSMLQQWRINQLVAGETASSA